MAGKILIIGILALFAVLAQAQILIPCHSKIFDFTSRHSLNISRYTGEWYVHEVAGSHIGNFPEPDYKCLSRNLRIPLGTDPLALQAVDTYIQLNDGFQISSTKNISMNDTRSPLNSIWQMTEHVIDQDRIQNSEVIILSADLEFSEWTIVYSCEIRPPNAYRYEIVSAMTRSREITPELRHFLKALIVGQGFRIGDHHPVHQTDCD